MSYDPLSLRHRHIFVLDSSWQRWEIGVPTPAMTGVQRLQRADTSINGPPAPLPGPLPTSSQPRSKLLIVFLLTLVHCFLQPNGRKRSLSTRPRSNELRLIDNRFFTRISCEVETERCGQVDSSCLSRFGINIFACY